MTPQVTILIPHYKTLTLTRLCLGLLQKYTDLNKAKVIVIDNDSQDESLPYLRSLDWIELIERKAIPGETPVAAHSSALDLGLARTTTPYVLSIHTDTLVKHAEWLDVLLQAIERHPNIAGVGSWKLESKPWWRQAIKRFERITQLTFYKLIGESDHDIEGIGKNYYYLRSHCALYRMEAVKKVQGNFSSGDHVAGKGLHKQLVEAGYDMLFLPSDKLLPYVEHINHATTVLNPSLSRRQKSVIKGRRRIEKALARMQAEVNMA